MQAGNEDSSHVTAAIVIGGSAGSLHVVSQIIHGLYIPCPLPIIICLHIGPNPVTELPVILQRHTDIPVKESEDKEPISGNHIYTAPPGYHLLIEAEGIFSLSVDNPVVFARPSIDVLFESAADAYRHHLLAILLSGANHDGANGLSYTHKLGGDTVVQRPDTAEYPAMPNAGLRAVNQAQVLTPLEIMLYINQNIRT